MVKKKRSTRKKTVHHRSGTKVARPRRSTRRRKKHGILGAVDVESALMDAIGIGAGAVISQMGALEADKHWPTADPRLVGAAKIAAGILLPDLAPGSRMISNVGKGFIAGGFIDIAMAFGAFKSWNIPAYTPVTVTTAAVKGPPEMLGYADQGGLAGIGYADQGGLAGPPYMNGMRNGRGARRIIRLNGQSEYEKEAIYDGMV